MACVAGHELGVPGNFKQQEPCTACGKVAKHGFWLRTGDRDLECGPSMRLLNPRPAEPVTIGTAAVCPICWHAAPHHAEDCERK